MNNLQIQASFHILLYIGLTVKVSPVTSLTIVLVKFYLFANINDILRTLLLPFDFFTRFFEVSN